MFAHVYVDDKEAYQAMLYTRGAWHVGADYGGRLFGTVNNRNFQERIGRRTIIHRKRFERWLEGQVKS